MLKYEFEILELGDEMVAVPVGQDAVKCSGVLKMNESAATVLSLLKTETSVETIVATLEKEYDTPKDVIANYVQEIIQKLEGYGLTI